MQSIDPTSHSQMHLTPHQGQRGPPALRYHRFPKLTLGRKLIFTPKSPSVLKVSNHARKQEINHHQKNPQITAQFSSVINGQQAKEVSLPIPHPSLQNTPSLPSAMNKAPPQPGTTCRTCCHSTRFI